MIKIDIGSAQSAEPAPQAPTNTKTKTAQGALDALRDDPPPSPTAPKYKDIKNPVQRLAAIRADYDAWLNRHPEYNHPPRPDQVDRATAPAATPDKPALLISKPGDAPATPAAQESAQAPEVSHQGDAAGEHSTAPRPTQRVAAYFMEWEPVTPTRSIDLWTRSSNHVKSATDLSAANLEVHSDQENATHYSTTAWYLPFTPQRGVVISSVDFDTSNVVAYSQTFGGKRVTAFGDGFPKVTVTFKMARAFYHKRYIRALRMAGLLTSNSLQYPGRLILHNILQERSVYDTMQPEERRRSLDEVIRRAANGDVQRSVVSRLEGFHLMVDRVNISQGEGELHVITVTLQATVLEFLNLGG